jgi:hypothetical protein
LTANANTQVTRDGFAVIDDPPGAKPTSTGSARKKYSEHRTRCFEFGRSAARADRLISSSTARPSRTAAVGANPRRNSPATSAATNPRNPMPGPRIGRIRLPPMMIVNDRTWTASTVGSARSPRRSPYLETRPSSSASTIPPVSRATTTVRIRIEMPMKTRNPGPIP